MNNDSWETPPELFDELDKEFNFEIDLCATKENKKCNKYCSNISKYYVNGICGSDKDASYWINPPYSAGNIGMCMDIVEKINKFNVSGTIVALTRFDPTTKWFKNHIDGVASEVRMLDKRITFIGAKTGYPFPCCVSIYRGYKPKNTDYYIWGI